MKKYTYIYILTAILFILAVIFYLINRSKNNLTETEVIYLLKNAYPEFINYSNQNLAPQSIKTEKDSGGWYVAFVQAGSGAAILNARCFFVSKDKIIRTIGEFNPLMGEVEIPAVGQIKWSIKTCSQ